MKNILKNGAPAIVSEAGEPVISVASCGVRYTGDGESKTELVGGEWSLDGGTATCGGAALTFSREGDGIKISAEYRYGGPDLGRTDEFIVLKGRFEEPVKTLVAPGVREVNGIKTNEMLTSVETMEMDEDTVFECGDFAALVTPSGKKYIAGYLTYREYFGGITVRGDGSFEVKAYTEEAPLPTGGALRSDVFYFTECDDIVAGLPRYCDLCVREMTGEPRLKFDVPYGFCTWYYYLGDVTGEIVTRSVEDLVRYRDLLPAKYMQIDDGWQVYYGQWEVNEKFSRGMKAYADEIKAAGLTPGLWFAPLWANKARVRQEHPEYFAVSRETGETTICFDFSVPEACDFLRDVMRRATVEWGYKYLKLDLITTTLGAYRYRDPSFNSLKNYRRMMEIVNETVPEDTFILGCTAPFGPSIGLVDGMRVSCDIGGDWDGLRAVFNAVLKRYYYHKRFFINDADCLIVRKAENEDDECRRNCTRTDEEIKIYISAAAASGGALMLSDKLRLMSEDQLRQISLLYPINTEAAIPLDLTERWIPGILDCGVRRGIRTLILINWEEKDLTLTVPLGAGGRRVFEFWDHRYEGVFNGEYETVLAPHTCRVLHITEAGHPAVIGCGNEVIPTLEQTFENGKLTFTFIKPGDTVYVAAESLSGDDAITEKIGDDLFRVRENGRMTVVLDAR